MEKEYQQYLTNIFSDAEKEIKSYLEIIKANSSCPHCGGSYMDSVCKYCGEENASLVWPISKIESILLRVKKAIANIPIEVPLNEFCSSLYSIEIPLSCVNEFLEEINYGKQMDDLFERVTNKSNKGLNISQTDLDNLPYLISKNPQDKDMSIIHLIFIVNAVANHLPNVNPRPMVSYEAFKDIVKYYVINVMQNRCGYPKAKCEILPKDEFSQTNEDELVLGTTLANHIRLNEQEVYEGYYKGYTHYLDTFFHELAHAYQYNVVFNGKKVDKASMLETKDHLLKKFLPDYYKENYQLITFEKDAFITGMLMRMQFLQELGLVSGDYDITMTKVQELQSSFFDETRIYHGNEVNINDLFANTIVDKAKELAWYPQVFYEYKVVGGKLLPKSREEITEDYEMAMASTSLSQEEKRRWEEYYSGNVGIAR